MKGAFGARPPSSRARRLAGAVALGLGLACDRSKPAPTPDGAAPAPGTRLEAGPTSAPDFSARQTPGDYAGDLPASQAELAVFAWQHFVALNWPSSAAPGALRGTPAADATFLQPDRQGQNGRQPSKPVWMGYYNKNEMLPADTSSKPSQSHTNRPRFNYANVTACDDGTAVTPCGKTITGSATTCFETEQPVLDEASQLELDYMFAQPPGATEPYQVLFLAKVNQPSYDYVVDRGFYIERTSNTARAYTASQLPNFGAICQQTAPDFCGTSYCLPCGAQSPYAEGTIHIKLAWRRLTKAELDSNRFFTADVTLFKGSSAAATCTTERSWGLVGMHIIHKTLKFPAFVFATWEHVDNLASNLTYKNTQTGGPDPGVAKPYTRVAHGSPGSALPSSAVQGVNRAVQQAVRQANPNLVWQYYQLVGVQGTPVDYAAQGTDLPDYYLANNVIESNQFFQSFVGVSASYTSPADQKPNVAYGPDGTTLGANVFSKSTGQNYDVGGCQGCHGNAQRKGADMSFLIPPFGNVAEVMGHFEFTNESSKAAKMFGEAPPAPRGPK